MNNMTFLHTNSPKDEKHMYRLLLSMCLNGLIPKNSTKTSTDKYFVPINRRKLASVLCLHRKYIEGSIASLRSKGLIYKNANKEIVIPASTFDVKNVEEISGEAMPERPKIT